MKELCVIFTWNQIIKILVCKIQKNQKKMASFFVSKDVLIIVYFAVTITTLTPFSNWFMHCSTTDLERFSDNYFKLKQTKNKLKLVVRDYSCFFMRKIPWKLSLVCTTLSRYIRHIWLDEISLTFSRSTAWWLGKGISDFFLFIFCWFWILSSIHLSNNFHWKKLPKSFWRWRKLCPTKKFIYI